MKQTIVLGNIITMDEKRPFVKAALVKNGVLAYIGDAEEAKRLADLDAVGDHASARDTQMLDYGDNFIYPGFLESHCHGHFAGDRFIGQANLTQVGLTDYDKYREIIVEEVLGKRPPDDGLRRCHRHGEGSVRKAGGADDALGRVPRERVVQEGLPKILKHVA